MATAIGTHNGEEATESTPGVPPSQSEIDWFDRGIKIANVVVSLAGFVAIVVSLSFTNKQLDANRLTTQAATWNEVSKQWLELDKLFIQNPDLRNYVYGHDDVPKSDHNYNSVMAQSGYVLDFIDYTLNPGGESVATDPFVQLWKNYAIRVFSNSHAVCRELLENEDEYTSITRNMGKQYCHRP
jgi:hypothetical protein